MSICVLYGLPLSVAEIAFMALAAAFDQPESRSPATMPAFFARFYVFNVMFLGILLYIQ